MTSLILSGWAQPADALRMLDTNATAFDYSDYAPAQALDALEQFQHATRVIGWSTGGLLALQAIAEGILKPEHLTLISAPYQFVSGNSIKGMDPLTFEQFRANYESNPTRTKTRFHALVAMGDAKAAEVQTHLVHHADVENTARWLPWLDYLAEMSLAGLSLANVPPTLMIHGMNDAVVPFSQADLLAKKLSQVTVNSWADAGHAPHLHDTERLRREMAAHRNIKVAA